MLNLVKSCVLTFFLLISLLCNWCLFSGVAVLGATDSNSGFFRYLELVMHQCKYQRFLFNDPHSVSQRAEWIKCLAPCTNSEVRANAVYDAVSLNVGPVEILA